MCRTWEATGRMIYNRVKTKAMSMENAGRIRSPVVRLGVNRVCLDE